MKEIDERPGAPEDCALPAGARGTRGGNPIDNNRSSGQVDFMATGGVFNHNSLCVALNEGLLLR